MNNELNQYIKEWISESIDYFRTFGFFSSEPKFADWQKDFFNKNLPNTEDGDYSILDQVLLGGDSKRVWNEDWEVWKDVINEHKQAVQRWGEISRGAFQPDNIRAEIDKNVSGVFIISFEINGEEINHRVHGMGWIDPTILVDINELISNSGIQFYALDTGDQSAFIVALKLDELEEIVSTRGWGCVKV